MRGEDISAAAHARLRKGSPPHARGRHADQEAFGYSTGITPACAGKTHAGFIGWFRGSDHPRMRGEDPLGDAEHVHGVGSPPHARGRRQPGR